jgi:transposase
LAHDCLVAQPLIGMGTVAKRIPNRSNLTRRFSFSKTAYRERHRMENAFCRLKDFRRIATRYDRSVRNFLAAVYLVATNVWWILWVWTLDNRGRR